MQNNGTFLKSSFNLNGTFVQMLHLQPNFRRTPFSIQYEISGTDGLIHEGELKITESNSKKQIISFECKLDETYFCKITGYYSESRNSKQTIRLFYKVENEVDDVVQAFETQKYGFRKVQEISQELDTQESESEDEEQEDNEEEDDDEGMTLEMRVEKLKRFSKCFSDEE